MTIEKLVDAERRITDVTNRVQTLEGSLGNTQQLAVAGAIEAYVGAVPAAIANALVPIDAEVTAAVADAAAALLVASDASDAVSGAAGLSLSSAGAVGDGITNDTAALRVPLNLIALGGRAVGKVKSRYRANNLTVAVGDEDITVDLNGSALIAPTGAYYDGIHFLASASTPLTVTMDTTTVPGKTLITWPGGIPADIMPNDHVKLVSDDIPPRYGTTNSLRCGYSLRIQSKDGNTATCVGTPPYASYYQTNIRAARFPRGRVRFANGSVLGDPSQPSGASDAIPENHLVLFQGLVMPEAENITVGSGPAPGIIFHNCVQARAINCRGVGQADLLGVAVGSLNSLGTQVIGGMSDLTRHFGDTSANSVPAASLGGNDLSNYGLDYNFLGIGGHSNSATTSALTCHEGAYRSVWGDQYVTGADKVIGARGDQCTWKDVVSDGCGSIIQVVKTINSMSVLGGIFRDTTKQALVCNQVGGVDQVLMGFNRFHRNLFECASIGLTRIFVPVIATGATVECEDNTHRFNGTEGGKAIISPYGTGSFAVDDKVDLRDAPSGVSGIVPLRLSSALKSVSGKILVLLRTSSQAAILSSILTMDAVSAEFVDLDIEVRTDDGTVPVMPPLLNSSSNIENVFISTRFGDSANNGHSSWARRTSINFDNGRIQHNSRDAVIRIEGLLTGNASGWTIAPGCFRGQRVFARNSNSGGFIWGLHGLFIAANTEGALVYDGATWAPAKTQVIGSRTWTPGTGSVAAGAIAQTVIAVTGARVGDSAAVRFSASLPSGLINLGGMSYGANTITATVWNPTAAAISTVNLTVTAEVQA